jgi:hypothetical protein
VRGVVAGKTAIPVLRHLARSGGTVISRCLGCMDGVVLLSEVHPDNMAVTQPIRQAKEWFGLVTDAEIARWKRSGPPSLLQLVALCESRARAKRRRLVLRDWTHLDFVGVPYAEPSYRFRVGEALGDAYEIREAITVRHPMDQFLSLAGLPNMAGRLTEPGYLQGCAMFARHAASVGFVRYEDFTTDPDASLRTLCDRLGIVFDPAWADKWHAYRTISGDAPGSGSRGSSSGEIRALPRADAPGPLLERFRASGDYREACSLLGYEL